MKIGEIAYKKAQEEAQAEQGNDAEQPAGASDDDDDAIDADFTDLEVEDESDDEQKSA